MKKYVLIVNGMVEEWTYSDVEEAKNEVFSFLKNQISRRDKITETYFIAEIPSETEEELAAKGGRCADLTDVLDYSEVVRAINEMIDAYESVGIIRTSEGLLVYGREDKETGEDKDIYLVEQNGNFVRE